MNPSLRDRYGRPVAIVAAGWIAVLSAIVLVDHGHWRHLTTQAQTGASSGQLRALEARMGALESQLAAQKRQPTPISAEQFAEHSHALETRLTRLEQGASHGASQQEVDTLVTRVSALEAVRARPVQSGSPSAQRKSSTAASTAPSEPPFRVLGLEMRGGESFLAIAPPRALSLAEMSVLRVGDVEDGWLLEALDSKAATFRFQGQPHRVELP
jgi:hypothetical protein